MTISLLKRMKIQVRLLSLRPDDEVQGIEIDVPFNMHLTGLFAGKTWLPIQLCTAMSGG